MSISFSNTLPEVFEYPSYEAPVPIPNSNTSAPLKSNAIGSFGKLKRFDFNFLFSVQITKLLVVFDSFCNRAVKTFKVFIQSFSVLNIL
jgi:hypothetical protein